MILCVSPNLCYDRVLVVRGFVPGQVHRAEQAVPLASGKGLNVARVVQALGGGIMVVGFVSGEVGRAIARGARDRGLSLDAVRVPGESRVCTLIVDPGSGETVINEAGVHVNDKGVQALRRRVRRHLDGATVLALTGTLPPGAPPDLFARLVGEAAPRTTILDTSGESLRHGLKASPSVVKCNRREFEEVLGRALPSVADVAVASGQLLTQGVGCAIVTLGEEGAVLALREAAWLLRPPRVEQVSTIGAGDSFTGGLAVGLLRGLGLVDAARLGMAAAASDVTTLLPGHVEAEAVQALLPQVAVQIA